MGQDRIPGRAAAAHQYEEENCHRTDKTQAPTFGVGARRAHHLTHNSNPAENEKNNYNQQNNA
jgi:hypothetical protein